MYNILAYIILYINNYTLTYIIMTDINECDKVNCYSNQLFPFGFEFGDESDIFISDDDAIPIQLDTGFIFYNTTYTEVFVSFKFHYQYSLDMYIIILYKANHVCILCVCM